MSKVSLKKKKKDKKQPKVTVSKEEEGGGGGGGGGGSSVADGKQEALEVTAALVPQRVLQGHVVLLQVQVLDGLQVKLGDMTKKTTVMRIYG